VSLWCIRRSSEVQCLDSQWCALLLLLTCRRRVRRWTKRGAQCTRPPCRRRAVLKKVSPVQSRGNGSTASVPKCIEGIRVSFFTDILNLAVPCNAIVCGITMRAAYGGQLRSDVDFLATCVTMSDM
jgi:hypothetical protein